MTHLPDEDPRETNTEGGNYNEKIERNYINAENVTFVENQYLSPDATNTASEQNQNLVSASHQSGEIRKAQAFFIIAGTFDANAINKAKLKAIEKLLQDLSGDTSLKIVDVEEGSIKLTLEGLPEALERLEELFNSGNLTEILGMAVEEVTLLYSPDEQNDRNNDLIQSIRNSLILRENNILDRIINFFMILFILIGDKGKNLRGANLSEARLDRVNLIGAKLDNANLSRVNLSRANLSWTNLSKANLREADLSGANLSWANLREANLSNTNLSGADLRGADLRRADLTGADLSNTKVENTKFGYNPGISD